MLMYRSSKHIMSLGGGQKRQKSRSIAEEELSESVKRSAGARDITRRRLQMG
jgi:hypothetical protein